MRKQLLFLCPLLLVSTAVWAAPVCVSGSLASYEALGAGGCSIGGVTFDGFAFSETGSQQPPINASDVLVQPITGSSDTGLSFQGAFGAGAGMNLDALISFMVSAAPGSITGDSLSMVGAQTGGGNAQVVETLCANGSFGANGSCTGTGAFEPQALNVFAGTGGQKLFDSETFASAASSLDVVKNIIVQGGTANSASSAGISLVINTVPTPGGSGGPGGSQIPEPDTLITLGSGLVLTALLLRKRVRNA